MREAAGVEDPRIGIRVQLQEVAPAAAAMARQRSVTSASVVVP
jgi:hypothetical protein